MSSSGFLTQMPFQTQTSYRPDPSGGVPPHLDSNGPRLAHGIPPPTNGLTGVQEEEQDGLATRQVIPSSDESIECAPYEGPHPQSKATPGNTWMQQPRSPNPSNCPIPLVEWIRQLRNDSTVARPMLPLRWAKIVPKKQQNILDSNDSWCPPRAGSSAKPGSLPLDLLQEITHRADQAVAHRLDTRDQEPQRPGPKPRSRPASEGHMLFEESADEAADTPLKDDDHATQYASDWSSSPPRAPLHNLPPDTSPLREVVAPYAQHGRASDISSLQDIRSRGEDVSDAAAAAEGIGPSTAQMQHPSSSQAAVAGACEGGPEAQKTGQGAANSQPAVPATNVRVTETPFPPKQGPGTPLLFTGANGPCSSFVAATYPEMHPSAGQDDGGALDQHDADANLGFVNPAMSSRAGNDSRLPVTKNHTQGNVASSPRPSRSRKHSAAQPTSSDGAHASPRHKRQKVEHEQRPTQSPQPDPDYGELDQRRLLQRRTFRRAISMEWSKRDGEDPDIFVPEHSHRYLCTSSRTESPVERDRQSRHLGSDRSSTPLTQPSLQQLSSRNVLVDKTRHARPSSEHPKWPRSISSVWSAFTAAYPNYVGTAHSFLSALTLLLNLQNGAREPHPSLWDDFIFRMATDYKIYRRHSLLHDQSVLPYQEYYHTHIHRPEHFENIVHREILGALSAELGRVDANDQSKAPPKHGITDCPTTRMTGTSQNQVTTMNHRDSEVPTEPPKRQVQPAESAKRTAALQLTPLPQSISNDSSERATRPRSHRMKRQSLPWDLHRPRKPTSIQQSDMARTTPGTPSYSTKRHASSTSKVANWLLSSRAAGRASPELEEDELPSPTPISGNEHRSYSSNIRNHVEHEQPRFLYHQRQEGVELTADSFAEQPHPQAEVAAAHRQCSVFAKFAQNYARLPAQRALESYVKKNGGIVINTCEW